MKKPILSFVKKPKTLSTRKIINRDMHMYGVALKAINKRGATTTRKISELTKLKQYVKAAQEKAVVDIKSSRLKEKISRKYLELIDSITVAEKSYIVINEDLHTYGSAFNIILKTKRSPEVIAKKLSKLKQIVIDISEKRNSQVKDKNIKESLEKPYKDLILKISQAEARYSYKK